MKVTFALFASVLPILTVAAGGADAPKNRSENRFDTAMDRVITAYNERDYEGVRRDFARVMLDALSVEDARSLLSDMHNQFGKVTQAVPDGGNGHLVQRTRRFFAITGDERDRRPLFKKPCYCLYLRCREFEFLANFLYMCFVHFFSILLPYNSFSV